MLALVSRPVAIAPVLASAFLLRSLITAVPPAMSSIRAELGLDEAVAGLTVGLPVVCFGVFAFVAPALLRRFGATTTMSIALVLLTAGALLRPLGSAAWLLVGTAGIGVGVAIGNVLVPVMIRRSRPDAVPRFMGYYTVILSLGATLGSLITGPLLAAGVSWQGALFGWGLVAAALSAGWLATAGGQRTGASAQPHAPLRDAARIPRTWLITVFMGLQSMVFYTCTTWVPTQLQSVGLDVAQAALGLALFNAVGMITSFFGPRLVAGRHGRLVWTIQSLGYATGLLLLLGGGIVTWLGVLVTGLMQGSVFALALMFIARTPDVRLVGGVSAIAQGVGYLIASVGPSGFGGLHNATGSWWPVQAAMAGTVLVVGVLGLRLVNADRTA